ncbi:MAG: hypothetical protein DI529_10740 [Chryseobacterium sp.]|nr:MAG: hypothetical protein DI529_10740 [Chryseobacterium sp.]
MVNKLNLDRNIKIDITKGVLIILVIIGHVLLGKLNANIARYIIYSFHMPIFLLVSGYLINIERLRRTSFSELIKKYILRLIIPWFIAILVYSIIEYRYSILQKSIFILYHPYYHLWYIPAFLGYVLIT